MLSLYYKHIFSLLLVEATTLSSCYLFSRFFWLKYYIKDSLPRYIYIIKYKQQLPIVYIEYIESIYSIYTLNFRINIKVSS